MLTAILPRGSFSKAMDYENRFDPAFWRHMQYLKPFDMFFSTSSSLMTSVTCVTDLDANGPVELNYEVRLYC